MTTEQLIRGKKINEKLSKWERLNRHFERDIHDPIKEVEELLKGYDNLMFNFDRNQIAQLMINALKDHANEKIERLTKQFGEL